MHSLNNFYRTIGLEKPESPEVLKSMSTFWNVHFLSNRHRDFIYKFVNNKLSINTRLSHFVENQSRLCTLCSKSNLNEIEDESMEHLFYNFFTTITKNFRLDFYKKYLPEENVTTWNMIEEKKMWFLGLTRNSERNNLFMATCFWVLKFLIWECKLKKGYLNTNFWFTEFENMLKGYLKVSKDLKIEMLKLNYNFCRTLTGGLIERNGG